MTGTRDAPIVELASQIYRGRGGTFEVVEEFPTFGGTKASAFEAAGVQLLSVANSLSP